MSFCIDNLMKVEINGKTYHSCGHDCSLLRGKTLCGLCKKQEKSNDSKTKRVF